MQSPVRSGSPKSWGESLRRYREEQRYATVEPGSPLTRARPPNDRTRMNPVSQKFDDDGLEAAKQIEEDLSRTQDRSRALKMSNRYGTPYNIMNWTAMRPLTGAELDPPRELFLADSRVTYNIVNLNPRMEYVGDEEPELESPKKLGKKILKVPNTSSIDYDVLSNVFNQDHERRDQEERQAFTETAERKLHSSRRMDPVLGIIPDPEKELMYTRQQERLAELHKMLKESHLPTYLRLSLGRFYDITRHVVTDEKGFADWCWKYIESKKHPRLFDEEEFKRRMDDAKAKDDQRSLHRISHLRYVEGVNRGYNIINNQSLETNTISPYSSTNSHLVSTVRPLTSWEKCLAESQGFAGEPLPVETIQPKSALSTPKSEVVSRFPPIHS